MENNEGFISRAILRNFRVSPRKARLVADVVRGKNVEVALANLQGTDRKTAFVLRKLLLSAVSNAKTKNEDLDVDSLFVKSICVDAGRTHKRFMPRAHGRASPIRKRHSTITVLLDEQVGK